jgi:CoA:oxalate CoA-transferase
MKSLAHLKVLDFTRVLAGPYCTAMLAELGADVIKIEPPSGDDYRHIGPFLNDGSSSLFEKVNRGKRSITLDLADAEDRAIAHVLAAEADVLVENFRPGVATKLGIGFANLHQLNPKLIYASISGFGQTGPMAHRPAYDIIIQAMSGIMSITGDPQGPPTLIGESIADVTAGVFATNAILASLIQRGITGHGQHLDISMLDSMLRLQPLVAAKLNATGKTPTRMGNRHAISAPFGAFKARDATFVLAVLNNKLFSALAKVIEQPHIIADPRFTTDPLRFQNEAALRSAIENWSMQHSATSVVEQLLAAGVPAAEVLDAKQAQGFAKQRGATALAPRLNEHGNSIRATPQTAWKKL